MNSDYTFLRESLGKDPALVKYVTPAIMYRSGKYKACATSDFVGLELEVENFPAAATYNIINADSRSWVGVADHSLLEGEGSLEFRLKAPLKTVALGAAISDFCSVVEALPPARRAILGSYRTSTHIHINMLNATHDCLTIFLYMYYAMEPMFLSYYSSLSSFREDNTFCIPINKCYGISEFLRGLLAYKLSDLPAGSSSRTARLISDTLRRRGDGDRYSAFNILSLGVHGTLEFRAPPLLLCENDIQDLVKIIQLLKYTAASVADDRVSSYKMLSGDMSDSSTPITDYFRTVCESGGYGALFRKFAATINRRNLESSEHSALLLLEV